MNTEFIAQRLQCSRSDKQDCMSIIPKLIEIAFFAREHGFLELDRFFQQEKGRFNDPFLIKAVSCLVDIGDAALIRQVLNNYILSGNFTGRRFLKNMVITETILAIHRRADIDHIFSFLVPSFFGFECEHEILLMYKGFIQSHGYRLSERQEALSDIDPEQEILPEP